LFFDGLEPDSHEPVLLSCDVRPNSQRSHHFIHYDGGSDGDRLANARGKIV
jgi:hypothetical protein